MKTPEDHATDNKPRLFVDAITGNVARLLLGEQAFTIPARLLPAAATEGTWLTLKIEVVPAPPNDTEERRARLADDDDGGDIKL